MSEMTDRELLELAARAADMYVLPEPWPDSDGWFFCLQHGEPAMHFRKYGDICYSAPSWNPLADDGDAFRLAVKLTMHATYFPRLGYATAATSDLSVDEYAPEAGAMPATRRAIVRAAAAIGAKS